MLNRETKSNLRVCFNSPGANLSAQDDAAWFEELSEHPDNKNIAAIDSGMMLAKQPLRLYASNPSESELHFSIGLIDGLKKDRSAYVKEFSAPPSADWRKQKTWGLANPFVKAGHSQVISAYKDKARQAKESRSMELEFHRFYLGRKATQKASDFIPIERIQFADGPAALIEGRVCVGVDLGNVRDFTAVSIVSLTEDERILIHPMLFLSNTDNRRTRQRELFDLWDREGHIKITRTPVMDKDLIVSELKNFLSKWELDPEAIVFDPALGSSAYWFSELKNYNCEAIGYLPSKMTGPTRFLERQGFSKKVFLTSKNPAALWHFACSEVNQKSKGYCLLSRKTTEESVDLPVATILALKKLYDNKPKKYEAEIFGPAF